MDGGHASQRPNHLKNTSKTRTTDTPSGVFFGESHNAASQLQPEVKDSGKSPIWLVDVASRYEQSVSRFDLVSGSF
jgi:hypothetical protein